MGLEEKDKNLAAYQMAAEVMNQVGIHEGNVFRFHQARANTKNYQVDLESLQYDILYGDKYIYDGENPFERVKIKLGIKDAELHSIEKISDGRYYIKGDNFTQSSFLEVNGELFETNFIDEQTLLVLDVQIADGDTVDVAIRSNSSTHKVLTRTQKYHYQEAVAEFLEVNGELFETNFIDEQTLLVLDVQIADGDTVDVAIRSNSSTHKVLTRTQKYHYQEAVADSTVEESETDGSLEGAVEVPDQNENTGTVAEKVLTRTQKYHYQEAVADSTVEESETDGSLEGAVEVPDQNENTGTVAETGPAKLVPILQEPEEDTDADAEADVATDPSGNMTDKSNE